MYEYAKDLINNFGYAEYFTNRPINENKGNYIDEFNKEGLRKSIYVA